MCNRYLPIIDTHRFSGSDGKEPDCQCRRPGFDPWVRKIPWRRAWQPTPAFLPRESHGQRSLTGYNPWGHKELDMTEWLTFFFPSLSQRKVQNSYDFEGLLLYSLTCLVSSSVTGSVHVSAPDCCLEHIFFFFFLKSLFNSPLPVKILFITLSSGLPFQWGLGSSPQRESYLLLSSCWCCYCWLQYCRSVQILLL